MTITLPQELNDKLLEEAKTRDAEVEEVALDILRQALFPQTELDAVEGVVKQIQAAGPSKLRPATGSLADALRDAPEDPDFDLEEWTKQWQSVEEEMRIITRQNDVAEGRR